MTRSQTTSHIDRKRFASLTQATAATAVLAVALVSRHQEAAGEPPPPKLALELELTSSANVIRAAARSLYEFRLDRAEAGARVAVGEYGSAELRLEAIRSASDGGALGIDGNSTVFRLKIARAGYGRDLATAGFPPARIDAALGFVADPWLAELERGYPIKPLSRTGSERLLGWPASDLAAFARVAVGPLRVAATFGNGEGQRFPERNTGKTTTTVAIGEFAIAPYIELSVAAVARDGSIGAAAIRERRFGGAATATTPWFSFGAEVVRAYGIADRGELVATLLAGWADVQLYGPLSIAARGATLRFVDGGRQSTAGGALACAAWQKSRGRLQLWLAIDRVTASGSAMALPGANAENTTTFMIIASTTAPLEVR